MNKTITINVENLSEEEYNLFTQLIEKSKKKMDKVWMPEENEKFYFLGPSGLINSSYYDSVLEEPEKDTKGLTKAEERAIEKRLIELMTGKKV
jgi:hypothetical protein